MKRSCLFFLFLLALKVSTVQAQAVYMSPSEALKIIFASSTEITAAKNKLSAPQKQALKKELGYEVLRDEWTFYIARSGSKTDGYALIDNEKGKMEPITFLTAISPEGEVRDVEVLVYRETHGSEVRQKSFLKQYANKSLNDPIRIGQDIKHITGATISSRSISTGVKRALALWNLFYGSKQ